MVTDVCLDAFEIDPFSISLNESLPYFVIWKDRMVTHQQKKQDQKNLESRTSQLFQSRIMENSLKATTANRANSHHFSSRQIELLSFVSEEHCIPIRAEYFLDPLAENGKFCEIENFILGSPRFIAEPWIINNRNPFVSTCGLRKAFKKGCHEAGKCWRKHKTEIIIGGLVVVAVIVTAVAISGSGGAAVAAGGALLDQLCKGDSEPNPLPEPSFPSKHSISYTPPQEDKSLLGYFESKNSVQDIFSNNKNFEAPKNSPYFSENFSGTHNLYDSFSHKGKAFPFPPPPFPNHLVSQKDAPLFDDLKFPSFPNIFTPSSDKPIDPLFLDKTVSTQLSEKSNIKTSLIPSFYDVALYGKDVNPKVFAKPAESVEIDPELLKACYAPSETKSLNEFTEQLTSLLEKAKNYSTSKKEEISHLIQSIANHFYNLGEKLQPEVIEKHFSQLALDQKIVDYQTSPIGEEVKKENDLYVELGRLSKEPVETFYQGCQHRIDSLLKGSSQKLATIGPSDDNLLILGINGINTKIEEAVSHQKYIKSLIPENYGVDFIYNHSNHVTVDLLEALALNYNGVSPNTAKLLGDTWKEFNDKHKENPSKKILQICHSQGALHVLNALVDVSPEVRERVLVLAIAPARVVPREMCYKSFNYASKKDVVHYGELLKAGLLNSNECGISQPLQTVLDYREELVLLDPHPGATGIDHDFQSPTFSEILLSELEFYVNCNGEYK